MEFPLLKNSIIWSALSEMGKPIFQPNGIFYWAGRAKKEAEISGTVGSIVGPESELIEGGSEKKVTFYIPALKDFIDYDPANIVPYAPMAGIPELRKHWQNWIIEKGKNAKNLPSGTIDLTGMLSLPVVVPGITFGIYHLVKLFLTPGETIISPNRRWGNYDSIITRNLGVKIDSFDVFTDDKKFNVEAMKNSIEESVKKQGKAVVIVNFPNNPTGYVPDGEEAGIIVKAVEEMANKLKKPIVVINDDAYEGYVYNEKGITASLFYELTKLGNEYIIPIKMDGASKEMLMYGGRVGFITFGLNDKWYPADKKDDFVDEINNKNAAIIRSTTSNSNRLIQSLMIKMFDGGIDKIIKSRQKIIDLLKIRYDLINKLLGELESETTAIKVDPNSGGFFLLMNISNKVKATDFNEHLLKNYKTGLIPIMKENDGINALRIAYSSIPVGVIPKLVENIRSSIKDLEL